MRIRLSDFFTVLTRRRVALAVSGLGIAAAAFYWGRCGTVQTVNAAPQPPQQFAPQSPQIPEAPVLDGGEYAKCPVASINGLLVTRQMFGEYLIERQPDRLENLVNRKIIEMAYQQQGFPPVTQAEIEASFREDLKKINVNAREFITNVLKRYNKTLFEWKEDVIRPRLMMKRFCEAQVKIDAGDLQKAYDSAYGEKVICRMIMWPKSEQSHVITSIYPKIRDDDNEFTFAATHQASPTLAANAGRLIKPITHFSTGNDMMEQIAFNLRDGEVSQVMEWENQIYVLKCDRHLPRDENIKMEQVRKELQDKITDAKVQAMIPMVFKELKDKAQPKYFITQHLTEDELIRRAEEALGGKDQAPPATPGNTN